MVTFEFKDGNLTFHRYSITSELYWFSTWTKVVEDSVSKNTYASDEIMPNLTQIILDSLGIKENISIIGLIDINIPDTIKEIIDTIEVNPSLERTILNFSADETCENMTLSLYGPDLIGDDSAENININLGAKKYDSYIVDDEDNQVDRTFSFIDSITGIKIDMTAVEISFDLYSNNDVTSYNTNQYQLKSDRNDSNGAYVGGKTLYTNLYYRQEYMKTQQVVA